MRLFYFILWWLHSFHLELALKAPVQNKQHIELLRADVRRWATALEDLEIRERYNS